MDPCWSYDLDNEGSNLFSECGLEVNAFSVFDKDMIINPSFEEINEGEELMELWTADDNNNNNSNNNNFTSKVILSNGDNNNFTSEMMLSDDDMNNNNWKRLPTIESRSAECEKGYGGFESSANNKKDKMMMMNTTTEFNSCQVPIICQVDGCKMDLSSSKYYHQRHRVCVDHSKTIKAMLHGVEQRFCQQCSRFHLLAEFDDDKRSCRRRLACHNERRRKTRFHIHWGMADASLLDMVASQGASPFLFPGMLSGNFNFFQEQDNNTSKSRHGIINILSSQNALPAVQELSGGENSGRAFSLLSTQTRAENHLHSNMGVFHIEAHQMKDGSLRKSNNSLNYNKKCFKTSSEIISGPTIDLQQLSTHLRRVEQQRSSV